MTASPPPLPNQEEIKKKKRIAKVGIWIGAGLCTAPTLGMFVSAFQMFGVFNEIVREGKGDMDDTTEGISSAILSSQIGSMLFLLGIVILTAAIILYPNGNKNKSSQPVGSLNSEKPGASLH